VHTRPVVRVRTNAHIHTRPAVRTRTNNARVHTRPAVRVRTNAHIHTRPVARVRTNAVARRAVAVRTNARIHTRPAVRAKANAHARAVGIPVDACVRINAGDCADAGAGTANPGSGRNSAVAPVITGDANATVDRLVDAAICLRVNAGGCGTEGAETADTTGSVVPSVIGDVTTQVADIPVNACVRINAGDCGNGTDPAGGTDPNRALPTIGSDVTLTAGELADGVVCLRINGGDCGQTAGSSDPTGSGPGSDPAGTPGGSDPTGSGAGPDREGVDPARYASLGAEADRFGGDGSVMGMFASAAPVATVGGTIRFSGGVLHGQLFGAEVWPVVSRLALDPAGTGKSSQLAHTGSGAAMLPLLIGGLLSLLMAGPLLARRRRN
jgi:LPXTG-motif cell wall-anchored protein